MDHQKQPAVTFLSPKVDKEIIACPPGSTSANRSPIALDNSVGACTGRFKMLPRQPGSRFRVQSRAIVRF